MSINKNVKASPHRLKTLECANSCGKIHEFSPDQKHASNGASKLKDLIKKKLDLVTPNNRISTLPMQPHKAKLQPIKEAKMKPIQQIERRLPTEQEKKCRLRNFLESKDELLERWKKEEKQEKQKFKKRLKLAALSSLKSLAKSKKKINQQQKHSLKNLYQKSTKALSPERYTYKNFNLRHSKDSNNRLGNIESQAYKYYLKNLLSLMEENRQELLESKKNIKKEIKKESKQHQREQKEHLISSKKELVSQIQNQLMREQQQDQNQRMERYRTELEAELQQELSEQIKTSLKQREQIFLPNQMQEQEHQSLNPERTLPTNKIIVRSKSTTDFNTMKEQQVEKVQALTRKEQEKCIKIIDQYIIPENEKLKPTLH